MREYVRKKKLTPRQFAAISDILGGSTGNRVHLGVGHWTPGYWGTRSRSKEAFAEFFAASLEEDKTSYKAMADLFPKTRAFYDKIIEEMLK